MPVDVAALESDLRAARDGRPPPAGMLDVVDDELAGVPHLRPADWELLCERGGTSPFWAIVWPSGEALAAAVAAAGHGHFAGRRVLELGCGLALPSLAAARAGADVLATDVAPEAVVFAGANLRLAGGGGAAAVLDVRSGALLPPGRFDKVLTADLLYDRSNLEPLLELVPRVLAPGGEVWVADPGRPALADLRREAPLRWPGVALRVVEAPDPVTHLRD